MSYAWYLVIAAVGAFIVLFPSEAEVTAAYLELQLRKLWLLFRLWPQFQLLRLRMMFMSWRVRYNRNNPPRKTE